MTPVLIYESMTQLSVNSFTNPIVQKLSDIQKFPNYFHIGSFSDASYFDLASRFLVENPNTVVVLLFEESQNTTGLGIILNQLLQSSIPHPILCLNSCPLTDKLNKKLAITFFENYAQMHLAIATLLQGNSNESESF
jgi:hypothetical protein